MERIVVNEKELDLFNISIEKKEKIIGFRIGQYSFNLDKTDIENSFVRFIKMDNKQARLGYYNINVDNTFTIVIVNYEIHSIMVENNAMFSIITNKNNEYVINNESMVIMNLLNSNYNRIVDKPSYVMRFENFDITVKIDKGLIKLCVDKRYKLYKYNKNLRFTAIKNKLN